MLVLTNTRRHMFYIFDELVKMIPNGNIYIANALMPDDAAKAIEKVKSLPNFIMVSTVYYSGTGTDIPSLNSCVIAAAKLSRYEIRQVAGRIIRTNVSNSNNRRMFIFPSTYIMEVSPYLINKSHKIIHILNDYDWKTNKQISSM